MPAPPAEEHRPVVEFNCPRCHAVTAYSAGDGGLTCTHCGYFEPPKKAVVGKSAEEFEFTVTTLERAAHGWGEARQELQCQSCGVYTSAPPGSLTFTCPFCGSNKVIQRESPQEVLRPRFLIPFKMEAADCLPVAREWLGSSWMTPRSLQQMAQVARFTGVYLPFWTFDATTTAQWRAQVGHTTTETYYVNGQPRTRTKTVWRWESGQAQVIHDDLLVDGTTHLSQVLLSRIRAYDLRELAPYEPNYLAGFQAQTYDIALEAAWTTARQQMRERTKQNCYSQASSPKIRNFSMNMDYSQESWRYILLPAYLATYQYRGKTYQVMVNGQTGAIAGQRPVDWGKVGLAIAALIGPGVTTGLVGLIMLALNRPGFPVAIIGFVLFIIGLVIALVIFQTANRMDDV